MTKWHKIGETVTTSDGKNIERTYNEDGKTEVITQNGQPTHTKNMIRMVIIQTVTVKIIQM